jgi:hypothetical protein
MGKRSRSEGMVWQPARSRLQVPLIALGVAALVALIGYMNAGVYDETLSPAPGTAAIEMPVHKAAIRDATYSAEPRSAPLPRRTPSPRGEVREASVDATH